MQPKFMSAENTPEFRGVMEALETDIRESNKATISIMAWVRLSGIKPRLSVWVITGWYWHPENLILQSQIEIDSNHSFAYDIFAYICRKDSSNSKSYKFALEKERKSFEFVDVGGC